MASPVRIDVARREAALTEALRGKVVRRVLLALSRFSPRLERVTVSLAEPANPLGGVDQRCRMRAWIGGHDGLRAEAINGGFDAAVARAAAQLAKRVALALDGGGALGVPRLDGRPIPKVPGRSGLRRRRRTRPK